jgi:ABC-type transporter MlaC component
VRADWRLRACSSKFRVLDLSVGGIIMAIVVRQEFSSILRNRGGIDGLVSLLEQRTSLLPASRPGRDLRFTVDLPVHGH